jgi:hypothetical protein
LTPTCVDRIYVIKEGNYNVLVYPVHVESQMV